MENARPDEPANLESVHCSACGVEFAVRGFTRGQVGMLLARHAATHSQGPVTPPPPESSPESPSSIPGLGSLFSSPEGSTVADVFSDFEDNYSKYKSSYDDPGQERFGLDSDELYHSSSEDANSSAQETDSQEAARPGPERETESGEYQGRAQGEAKSGANSDASSDSGARTNQSTSTDTSYGESPSSSSSQSAQESSTPGNASTSGSPGPAQNLSGEGRDPFPGAGPSAAPAGSRTPGANPGQGMSQGASPGVGLPGSPSSGAAGGLPGAGAAAGAAGAGDAASKLGDAAGSGAAPGGGYKKDIDKVLNSAQANLSDPSLSTGEALEETSRDAAKVAATAGTAAAIQYGTSGAVPEPVARKLAESKPVKALTDKAADKAVDKGLKWGKRGLKGAVLLGTAVLMPVVLMATLLVGAAVVSSTNDNSGYLWAAPIDPASMDIPQPYAEAYYSTGVQFNIPWTLLAAVGATSSYHGRVNPYLQPVPLPVPRVPPGGASSAPACSVSQPTHPGNPAAGSGAVPEDLLTVSGHEALKPGDPRLVTFEVANRSITVHKDFEQLFFDFLTAWDQDPVLGRGRLNIDKGVGPVDSYELRHARVTTNRWSDHAGYAIDIRYDLLPAFSGYQMTPAERDATRRLLERFPQLGWGGDYDMKYMDEMHFNVASCARWSGTSTSGLSAIYVIGDSLADPKYGAASTHSHFQKAAKDRGFSYVVYAEQGKSTSWGIEQIRANPPPPGVAVVMSIGTNDAASRGQAQGFRSQLKRAMDLLKGNTVYWVNVRHDPAKGYSNVTGNDKIINQTLVEEQAGYPNLRVLDWDSWSRSNGVSTADGIHYTADGYSKRATYILDSISSGSTAGASQPVTGGTLPVASVSPVPLVGPGVLPTPEGRCPTLPETIEPLEGDSPLRGYGPLMLSPAALSRSGAKVDTGDLQNICKATNTLGAVIAQTAVRVAMDRKMSYPDSFRSIVEAAQSGDSTSAQFIESFWTSVMDAIDIVGSTDEPVCSVAPMPTGGTPTGAGGTDAGAVPPMADTTPRQAWIADAISDVWACELVGQPLRSVLRAEWNGSSIQYSMATREQARARAIGEAVQVAWSYSEWGEAPQANRDCKPNAPLAGVFPLSLQVFSENLPERLAGKNRCDVEANIVAAARAFRSGEIVEPSSREGGSRGWLSLYGGWGKFDSAVTGPEAVQATFDEQGPWAPISTSRECEVKIGQEFSAAAQNPNNPLATLTSAQVRSYALGGRLDATTLGALDAYLGELASRVASSGLCSVEREEQWLWLLQQGSLQVEKDEKFRHPRSSPTPTDVSLAMAHRLDVRLDGPQGRPTPQRDRTALLQRFSPVRLGPSLMPTPPPVPTGLGTGPGYVSIAVSVYGGFYAGSLGAMSSGGFSASNCPQVAPENTLRDGLDTIGIAEICRQAVSQAATPQAALAIMWNLGKGLGHVYPNPYDCSELQSTAYREGAGFDIVHTTRNMVPWDGYSPDPHYQELPMEEARPGDLLVERTSSANSEHVLMYLGEFQGKKVVVHTDRPSDVSRVEYLADWRVLYEKPVRRVVPVTEKEKQALANLSTSLGGSVAVPGLTGFTVPASGTLLGKASQMKDVRPFAPGATANSGDRMDEWLKSDRTVVPGTPRAYAVEQLARFGWGLDQWPCLDRLWWHESGWNHLLLQSGGSGYGIPQATPGSNMASAGSDWKSNPKTQINWGLNYIANYGWWSSYANGVRSNMIPYPENLREQTPCGVWETWRWRAQPNIDGVGTY